MDKLNKLTHAGLSFFDGNQEYFDAAKWEESPLGARKSWTQPTISFVSLLATLPHPAAVFWGKELSQVGNLSWGHASETYSDHGKSAEDLYPGEGYDLLRKCMFGRTVTADTSCFLTRTPEYGTESHILLSPISDEHSKKSGVFAQLLVNTPRDPDKTQELYLPGGGDDDDDDDNENDKQEHVGETSEQTTPTGTSPELKEDGKQDDSSPQVALESVGTKEDDEEYFKQKRKEGKNEDGPEEGDENSGGHFNEKPSKKPYFIQDGQKLNLKQNRLFRKFAQMLPTGLAILDQEAEALFVNDKFFELTSNKSHKSFRAWPESIHPDDYDRVMTEYREAFSKREGVQVEFRCLIGAKPDPWRMFLMRPLSEEQDNTGYIVAVVDITDLKAAELSQRKAAEEAKDRKEQQERFVDMISHEIRNPLSAILHSTEEIRDLTKGMDQKGNLAKDLLDSTDTILLCVAHQSSLVDEILQFSKLDAAMLTLAPSIAQPKYDLAETLKLFQPELRAKNIGFEYAMDVSFDELKVGYVIADLKRIKQVLVNLMTNAIKFTAKAKGEREIFVGMGASAQKPDSYPPSVCFFDDSMVAPVDVTLSSEWGQGETLYLMVAVKDTGIGIDEEGQQKLFERFRQATPKTQEKYGGSGLGLFISRRLTQLHGGDIGVSSKQGDGSTFGFYFKVRRTNKPDQNDGDVSEEEEEDNLTLAQHATADVEARSRAQSAAKSNKGEEFNQPHMKDEEVPDLEKTSSKNIPESLINPETKLIPEAHPGISSDHRMDTTAAIADKISSPERQNANLVQEQEDAKAKDNGRETTHEKESSLPKKSQNAVLLAEDNIINQKVLTRQLKSKGYEVTPANNGKEAVAAVENNIAKTEDGEARAKGPFDIILMDQEMPYLTGNAATKAIRKIEQEQNTEPMPILGVSANVREEQKQEMIDAGMNDIVTKPFKVDELVTRIKGLIDNWD